MENHTIVTLKKGEGRTIKAGGAWIFDNEIDTSAADSCCAAKTEQVCDSAKKACCKADSATCPKAACDSAKCDKPCAKK